MSGPRPTPRPETPAQIVIALARSARGKTLAMIDRVDGMISAPPMPMATRAAIRWLTSVESVAASDESVNTMRPTWSARARPNRSPSAPIVSRRPANTRTYASTIHWRSDAVAENVRWIVGRATLRTVLSSPMSTRLRERTASVHQRRA